MHRVVVCVSVVAALAVAGCAPSASSSPVEAVAPSGSTSAAPATSGSPVTAVTGSVDEAAAESACTAAGGMLVDRSAAWNTNGDESTWVPFAGRLRLCELESGTGEEATRIAVDLVTLASDAPTLAAIAYLSKVPATSPPQVGQNPAGWYCATDLGGASAFGTSASGGGWVDPAQPVFVVMNLCVFADGSAIDEFGLWYHANGIIRGADLAPLFAYQPGDDLPPVYPKPAR